MTSDDIKKLKTMMSDDIKKLFSDLNAFEEESNDVVNHPEHYNQGDVECIDAIESALSAEEFRGYCKGNAVKYIWREAMKGKDESFEKAIWYLNRALLSSDK
jgi:hypothetical protein